MATSKIIKEIMGMLDESRISAAGFEGANIVLYTKDKDYFFEEMRLKIMTFDTCQGEERDICRRQ